jgi:hypothetical protein
MWAPGSGVPWVRQHGRGALLLLPTLALAHTPHTPPPPPTHTPLQVIRLSDGLPYAMKKIGIGAMSQKEIADTLNEIRCAASFVLAVGCGGTTAMRPRTRSFCAFTPNPARARTTSNSVHHSGVVWCGVVGCGVVADSLPLSGTPTLWGSWRRFWTSVKWSWWSSWSTPMAGTCLKKLRSTSSCGAT